MLVLGRSIGEKIQISDDITITLVDIRGDRARIGIEAPKDIPVHRDEVYQKIQREREENGE